MSDNDQPTSDVTLLTEVAIRLAALENVLIKSNIVKEGDLAKEIANTMMQLEEAARGASDS